MALSRRMPFGSRVPGRRSIAPPGGSGVSLRIPASASARELATPM
jgi:hypothetical protein